LTAEQEADASEWMHQSTLNDVTLPAMTVEHDATVDKDNDDKEKE